MDQLSFFKSLALKDIERFVIEGVEESLHLGFKTTSSKDLSDKNDKRTLSIAPSGFANSEGGLVIWGVDARQDTTTKIDCAVKLVEIDSVRALGR